MKRKMKAKDLKNFVFRSSLALAATFSIMNFAAADVPVSNSLPVPNYVNGANLKYDSGLAISKNAGYLSDTVQTNAATAADASAKLNVDLGCTSGNVAQLGYNSYNIGAGKTVNYNFGAANQAALNKVTTGGAAYASSILGNITQTGKGGAVFVINPNGILFGANSKINVDSFTASTLDVASDMLKSSRKIQLQRGVNDPASIVLENGAKITTKRSAILASNQIDDNGATITGGTGNVQLVTGDGVIFTFDQCYNSKLATADDVEAAESVPTNSAYQAIDVDGNISGHNVNILAKINNSTITPFQALVNVDGVITASNIVSNNGGNIILYANNVADIGKTDLGVGGVTVNGTLKAGVNNSSKYPGTVKLVTDKPTLGSNASIKTDCLYLAPTTEDKLITLGNTILPFINDYNVSNSDLLNKVEAKKIILGNGSDQTVLKTFLSDFYLGVKNGAAVDLTLNTTGDVFLSNYNGNANSITNFTNPDDVYVSAYFPSPLHNPVKLGKINAQDTVILQADLGGKIIASDICAEDIGLGSFYGTITTGNLKTSDSVYIYAHGGSITTKNINAGDDVRFALHESTLKTGNICAGGSLEDELFEHENGSGADSTADASPTTHSYSDILKYTDADTETVALLSPDTQTTSGYAAYDLEHRKKDKGSTFSSCNINVCDDIKITHERDGLNFSSGTIKAGDKVVLLLGDTRPDGVDTDDQNLDTRSRGKSNIKTGSITAGDDIVLSTPDTITTGNISTKGSLIAGYLRQNTPPPPPPAPIVTPPVTDPVTDPVADPITPETPAVSDSTATTETVVVATDTASPAIGASDNEIETNGDNHRPRFELTKAECIKTGSVRAADDVIMKAHKITKGSICAGGNIIIEQDSRR